MGGGFVGRLWPRDEDERRRTIEAGYDLDRQLDQDELVRGDDAFFSATGVTDGDFLQGVRYPSARAATTESIVMRSRTRTIRRILARHDREKMRALQIDAYG
jgi:fructose-1,6-bisphosphatase II